MSKSGKAVLLLLLFVGGYALLDYTGVIEPSGGGEPAGSGSHAGEASGGRSYGEVLAVEQTGASPARQSLVRRFDRLLDDISDRCSRSREWAFARIRSGHRTVVSRGGDVTLMDVAEGWSEAVKGAASRDCRSTLAALVASLHSGR